ncbi:MAG: site-2 protease family protein, partial [Eubacteriales bacterium]
AFLLAICIHECAHMLTAKAVGLNVESLYVLPFGCAAEISGYGTINTSREIITAAAGPAVNIMVACALTMLPKDYLDTYVMLFIWVNVTLAAVNLLPVLPLDGGRIMMAAIKIFFNERTAWKILNWAGVAAGIVMCLSGMYMVLNGSVNPTWLIMGVFLLAYAAMSLKNFPFASYRNAEEKRKRLAKKGSANVKQIAVMRTATLREVLREMESSKMNIITVLNDDFSIRATLSEIRVLDAAAKYGVEKKVGELT